MLPRAAIAGATLTIGRSGAAPAVDTNTVNPRSPWIDGRETRQQTRICNGVLDGSPTSHEFQRLERGERRHLDRMLDRQSAAIYHQRHDRQGMHLPRR